jgi:abhydrolase domain-containing protein 6
MKRRSKKSIALIVACILAAVLAVLYFVAPPYLYNSFLKKRRAAAHVTVKTVDIPGFRIVYAEGGTGTAILMLHGFGGDKDNWSGFAKFFTPDYRVIIPDLPGFGESTKQKNAMYNIMAQVERLHSFVKELHLKKFHIIGNSMGGSIAGNFAVSYPQMVITLGLLDSAGVESPVKSERTLLLEKGINPLLVNDVKDYDRYLQFVFSKPPKLPYFIKRYLAQRAAHARPLNEKIYRDISSTDTTLLEKKLSKITVPTLIAWGDKDRVIDISSVSIFKKIKKSKVAIIKDCGHVPMIERPGETAAIYKDFLKGKE